MARQQPEPQRFLFVFIKKSLSDYHKDSNEVSFNAGMGGELTPVMTLEKPLDELTNFTDLAAESLEQKKNWDIVVIAALSGENGLMPSADSAFEHLDTMIKTIENGGDLSKYLTFDKEGTPIIFQ